MKYMITARACWFEGCEDPSGGRPDLHHKKSRTLSKQFEATNLKVARSKARRCLYKFRKQLPREKMA